MIARGKHTGTLMLILVLAACAASERRQPDTSIEEAMVFIEATKPETVEFLRYRKPLHYDYVNDKYIMMEDNDDTYLIEFRKVCEDLSADTVVVEFLFQRAAQGLLRAKLDTIRGCLINEIYKLPEKKNTASSQQENSAE